MISVNEHEISEEAILNEMQYHEAASLEEAKYKAARSLVIAELVRQAAKTNGYDVADDFVSRIMEDEVGDYSPSDEELLRYYENNQSKFYSSPLVEARHILLAASPEDQEARASALDQAQQLITQLRSQADSFSALAKAHSACPSSETGGQLGQLSKGQTVPEFERQIFASEPGLCTSPIESRYGVHVVFIDHKEPGRLLPFSAVQEKISSYLQERQKVKAVGHFLQNLANEATIIGLDLEQTGSPLMQ